jgi:hypothetical protein
MHGTDPFILIIYELLLVALSIHAAYKDSVWQNRASAGDILAKMARGDSSMNTVHMVYAAAVASTLLLINDTGAFDGHKALIVFINFFGLSYLFYFSPWFRNEVFLTLLERRRKD